MTKVPSPDEIRENEELIEAWVSYCLAPASKQKTYEGIDPSWQLDRIVSKEPERALNIVIQLVEKAPEDSILANVAAGPLENLLYQHGELIISLVEEIARKVPKFRKCLRAVWGKDSMSPEIWKRIDKACGSEPQW